MAVHPLTIRQNKKLLLSLKTLPLASSSGMTFHVSRLIYGAQAGTVFRGKIVDGQRKRDAFTGHGSVP